MAPRRSSNATRDASTPAQNAQAQWSAAAEAVFTAAQSKSSTSVLPVNAPIIAYVRVSTREQSKYSQGHVSLEAQKAAITAFIRSKAWTGLITWFTEVGSAKEMSKQRELMGIQRRLRGGERFVVYDVSRLTRNLRDGANFLFALTKKGVETWIATDGIQYRGTVGVNSIHLQMAIGDAESRRTGDKVRAALAYCRARGDFMGRAAPFGQEVYRGPQGQRRLRQNRQEMIRLRDLRQRWAAFEGTKAAFVRQLNEESTFRGKPWTTASVTRTLTGDNLRMNALRHALDGVAAEVEIPIAMAVDANAEPHPARHATQDLEDTINEELEALGHVRQDDEATEVSTRTRSRARATTPAEEDDEDDQMEVAAIPQAGPSSRGSRRQ